MNIYSNQKPAWHLDSIQSLRDKVPPFPKHVQLILSDLCNQSCGFCSYRMDGGLSTELFRGPKGEKNPNRKIPTEKALEILRDAKDLGAKAIQFTGGGEPTVHPDCFSIIKYAKEELELQVGLVTNGTKLQDCPNDLDWVRISIDAGTAETYNSIRHSDRFEEVLGKISDFSKRKNPECVLGIGYVVTPDNMHEIVEGVKRASETGASYIRLSAMFSEEGDPFSKEDYYKITLSIAKATLLYDEVDGFEIVNLFKDRVDDLDQGAPDYEFCGYQHLTTYIGGDQCIYRCCMTAYTSHGKIGDLKNESLVDWWTSRDREQVGTFNAKTCKMCMFNEKNRVLNYMVRTPKHVDFV